MTTDTYPKDTLGYHRQIAAVVFGEDSAAITFLDEKIASSPNGANEGVVMPEGQVVALLMQLHVNGEEKDDDPVEPERG